MTRMSFHGNFVVWSTSETNVGVLFSLSTGQSFYSRFRGHIVDKEIVEDAGFRFKGFGEDILIPEGSGLPFKGAVLPKDRSHVIILSEHEMGSDSYGRPRTDITPEEVEAWLMKRRSWGYNV